MHESNPVLRWMLGNVMITRNPASNQKLDKARSGDKIDGVMFCRVFVSSMKGYSCRNG